MSLEAIPFTTEAEWLAARAKDVTSTEVAALFGLSPWCTEFELWHRKREGLVVTLQENERMKWGTLLQDSIAKGIAEEQRWKIRRMSEYLRDPALRMGASFDFSIEEPAIEPGGISQPSGLLEVKNVDSLQFKRGWVETDGQIEAPPHIELQVQYQLAVSGRAFSYLGALIGGNRVALIQRTPQADIIASIRKKVAAFWASIEANTPPTPDFSRDSAFIARLYGYADPGKVLSAEGNERLVTMARHYEQIGSDERKLKKQRSELRAQLLIEIGDAEKVMHADFTISAGVVGPSHVEYDRDGYRNLRVYMRNTNGEAK